MAPFVREEHGICYYHSPHEFIVGEEAVKCYHEEVTKSLDRSSGLCFLVLEKTSICFEWMEDKGFLTCFSFKIWNKDAHKISTKHN